VWRREAGGRTLTFHLAGINNQNFIMRDEETGSYWQQISGRAVAGPMQGSTLKLVHSDELSFGLWRKEQPDGIVLAPDSRYQARYETADWERSIGRMPTVIKTNDRPAREIELGLSINGAARAFAYEKVKTQKVVQDFVGSTPVLLVLGPDGVSVRAFENQVPPEGKAREFYTSADATLIDSSGERWGFNGCSQAERSRCLPQLDPIKDYWFDWKHYHPDTTSYQR
jgi:hypothetical protein